MTRGNSTLNKSRYTRNNDEFYTTYETIEKELVYYKTQLQNKIILCNCDDPFESNFSKYFIRNFNKLKLKRLITTSYGESKITSTQGNLLDTEGNPLVRGYGYVMNISKVPREINENTTDKKIHNWLRKNRFVKKLKGIGDFRSSECIKYLKKADVVITNPPFSLFREFISLITEFRKQFLVIGNANALTYKEIFPLIKNNKAWIGYKFGDMSFKVPSDSKARKTRYWVDERGQKWRSLGNAMWLTNIDIQKRHESIVLKKNYMPSIYPKFDGYNAIEVSHVANIPIDYDGIMAVPITFLNKYNPTQFVIIGEANHGSDNPFDLFKPVINGKLIYKRILIKHAMGEK